MTDFTLVQANIIATVTLEKARETNAQPLTVVVLDAGGHIKTVMREDESGIARFEIAYGKAWGALGMGISSRGLAARAAKFGNFFTALAAATDGKMIPVPGGVLIKNAQGQVLGAVGASGGTGDEDEIICIAGVHAAGYVCE